MFQNGGSVCLGHLIQSTRSLILKTCLEHRLSRGRNPDPIFKFCSCGCVFYSKKLICVSHSVEYHSLVASHASECKLRRCSKSSLGHRFSISWMCHLQVNVSSCGMPVLEMIPVVRGHMLQMLPSIYGTHAPEHRFNSGGVCTPLFILTSYGLEYQRHRGERCVPKSGLSRMACMFWSESSVIATHVLQKASSRKVRSVFRVQGHCGTPGLELGLIVVR